MIKRIAVILLCFALLSLCACGKAETQTATSASEPSVEATAAMETTDAPAPIETQAETEAKTEAETEPETFIAATIDVDFAKDSQLVSGQYESFKALESPQTKIILSTNATVRDFKVLALTNGDVDEDGNMTFDVEELYTLDRLTADRPLVVSTTFYGLIPNNGISYLDETGVTRTFAVDMSGEDGSLYLWEID